MIARRRKDRLLFAAILLGLAHIGACPEHAREDGDHERPKSDVLSHQCSSWEKGVDDHVLERRKLGENSKTRCENSGKLGGRLGVGENSVSVHFFMGILWIKLN